MKTVQYFYFSVQVESSLKRKQSLQKFKNYLAFLFKMFYFILV